MGIDHVIWVRFLKNSRYLKAVKLIRVLFLLSFILSLNSL